MRSVLTGLLAVFGVAAFASAGFACGAHTAGHDAPKQTVMTDTKQTTKTTAPTGG